ncbi:MAG TPA: sugar phosphate nucleotidyltransferase [Thermodesulfobacteriota bacterium]|nr:sugar phosphate nucleotidyltransferase [Thermodesulfobacteriota bacterium]
MSLYALIMAGGEGKRFWPLSSKDNPKQFLNLTGDNSLLRNTYERICGLVKNENIFVVTTKNYVNKTAKHLPELNKNNILAEPVGKNTGPCIYYGSNIISDLDKDAVIVVLPADHAISNKNKFLSTLKYAIKICSKPLFKDNYPLVTLGIKPTRPDTGYGYIKKNDRIHGTTRHSTYTVSQFTEKPDGPKAERYIKTGKYFWNSGIFVWKASSILKEFSIHCPQWDSYSHYDFCNKSLLGDYYKKIIAGPVDKMILEKSKNTVVIPASFEWSDIGTWQSLDEYLRKNSNENIQRADSYSLDCSSNMIIGGKKPVVTIGVNDLIVVDSKQGILVINKNESQKVKHIAEKLGK